MVNKNLRNFCLGGLYIFAFVSLLVFSKEVATAETPTTAKVEISKTKSLCQISEQTIWSCTTTKNKIASVCASKGVTAEKGYIQYRFGTSVKVEFEFPKEKANSQKSFKYSRYTRPLVTMLQLTFENNGYNYEIHDDDNSEEKPPIRSASIDVSGGDNNISINCKQPTYGSLMKLEDIVPKDEN